MGQVALLKAQELMTQSDIDILTKSKFKGFEPHEIEYCAKICQQLSLSPFLNQIHFVKRRNKDGSSAIAAQVGIDGFRLAAQRTNAYAGSDDVIFEYGPDKKRPVKATATVYKIVGGVRCGFSASVRWDEFYNPVGGMWDRLPHQMIGKCAEAQALRKAFPAELSDMYVPEEMSQADRPNKAEKIQQALAPEPKEKPAIEVEGQAVAPPVQKCTGCGGANLMVSRYDQNTMYCRDCKNTQARAD